MKEFTKEELRMCLLEKLSGNRDTLNILSAVSGIPKEHIDNFVKSGEIALGDFYVLKGLA